MESAERLYPRVHALNNRLINIIPPLLEGRSMQLGDYSLLYISNEAESPDSGERQIYLIREGFDPDSESLDEMITIRYSGRASNPTLVSWDYDEVNLKTEEVFNFSHLKPTYGESETTYLLGVGSYLDSINIRYQLSSFRKSVPEGERELSQNPKVGKKLTGTLLAKAGRLIDEVAARLDS